MTRQLNLGIVWKDGKIINHRSLLKVLFNPILRCLGWQIASLFEDDKFVKYVTMRVAPITLQWSFAYDALGCTIDKKRRII